MARWSRNSPQHRLVLPTSHPAGSPRIGSHFWCAAVVVLLATSIRLACADDVFPLDSGAIGVSQAIRRLETTGSVLHVVAHPDDEDGPLLTYSARGLGVRTMLFSITRGEGGANLISADFFDRLGVLRSLEHLKSASYYGNSLYYSGAVDYGYSKTLAEARRQWQEGEPILADLVEVIRRERPTLIVSRFRGDIRDGHGHHQMAGVLSHRAFVAAADPTAFPEQLQRGLFPWQALKLYTNNIRPNWRAEDKDAWTIAVPTGDFDPWMGRSYAQIARFGLGFQRSQGFGGHRGEAGPSDSYYRLANTTLENYAPDREDHLFSAIDTTLSGFASRRIAHPPDSLMQQLRDIDAIVKEISSTFRPGATASLLPRFSSGLVLTAATLGQLDQCELAESERSWIREELRAKAEQFEQAIVATIGLEVSLTANGIALDDAASGDATELRYVVPGQEFLVAARLVQRIDADVHLKSVEIVGPSDWKLAPLSPSPVRMAANEVHTYESRVQVSEMAEPSRPGWERESIREPFYTRRTAGVLSYPLPTSPLEVAIQLQVDGTPIKLTRTVDVRFRDPMYGDIATPLMVVPAVGVAFGLSHGIVPASSETFSVEVTTTNVMNREQTGTIELELPPGWSSEPSIGHWTLRRGGESRTERFTVHRPLNPGLNQVQTESQVPTDSVTLRAVAKSGGREYREGFVTVTARDLDRAQWYRPAEYELRIVDVRLERTPRVGYIAGSGDEVAESLGSLRVFPTQLSDADLASGDFSQFDIIFVGVRAYAVRDELRRNNGRLLEYVKQGGVLIVQYQTPEFDNNFGPFPYQMGRSPEEVSEEDAVVTMLHPEHPLWNVPNKITERDFDGWVEQRGSKFLTSWDDHYVPLLECHDTDQSEQRGGMVVTEYGSGIYVYSAYAWYRQLPFGVPGAYRIMANMLSL